MAISRKYVDLDSSYRNRNLYSNPGEFVVPITQSSRTFLDPVLLSSPWTASSKPAYENTTQFSSSNTEIALDSAEPSIENFYKGNNLEINGEYHAILAYNKTTKVATVETGFSTVPPIGTNYYIRRLPSYFVSRILPFDQPVVKNITLLNKTPSIIPGFYSGSYFTFDNGSLSGKIGLIGDYNPDTLHLTWTQPENSSYTTYIDSNPSGFIFTSNNTGILRSFSVNLTSFGSRQLLVNFTTTNNISLYSTTVSLADSTVPIDYTVTLYSNIQLNYSTKYIVYISDATGNSGGYIYAFGIPTNNVYKSYNDTLSVYPRLDVGVLPLNGTNVYSQTSTNGGLAQYIPTNSEVGFIFNVNNTGAGILPLQLNGPIYARTSTTENSGYSIKVSSDGTTVVWGAPDDNGNIGAVYTLIIASSIKFKIIPTDNIGSSLFGTSINLNGDGSVIVIGGPGDNSNIGATWIFTNVTGYWVQTAKLVATGWSGTNPRQGTCVCISDNSSRIVVGCPTLTPNFPDPTEIGAVYTFNYNAGWTQGEFLTASDNIGNSHLGQSVCISGDLSTVVAGGPGDNSNIGAAWVWTYGVSSYNPPSKILPDTPIGNPQFGYSVEVDDDGSTFVAGGPYDNTNVGAAWIYYLNLFSQKLIPTLSGNSGYSVSISSDGLNVIVGSPLNSANNGAFSLFLKNGSWSEAVSQTPYVNANPASFGSSVNVSANGIVLVSGNPGDYTNSMYINPTNENKCMAFLSSNDTFSAIDNIYGVLIPNDVTSMTVKLWGAGGANAGGSGGFTNVTVNVATDEMYYLVVGKGGKINNINNISQGGTNSVNSVQRGFDLVDSSNRVVSISVSRDGMTIAVGDTYSNGAAGRTLVYIYNNGDWTLQQTVIGTLPGPIRNYEGQSVSLSSDGNTLAVGAPTRDNVGHVGIYTRTLGVWTLQSYIQGTGSLGFSPPGILQGFCVSISGNGDILALSGPSDNSYKGAVWIFTRTLGVWTQQTKIASPLASNFSFGWSISLSEDGTTLAVGASGLNFYEGATLGQTYVYKYDGFSWNIEANALQGTGSAYNIANQGVSVALSADGNTLAVGGYTDGCVPGTYTNYIGAVWIFTRSLGVWTQQGSKLVGTGYIDQPRQGLGLALSPDGNLLSIGGPYDNYDFSGAYWKFTRNGGVWSQLGEKIVVFTNLQPRELYGMSFSGINSNGQYLGVASTVTGNYFWVDDIETSGDGGNGSVGSTSVVDTISGVNFPSSGGGGQFTALYKYNSVTSKFILITCAAGGGGGANVVDPTFLTGIYYEGGGAGNSIGGATAGSNGVGGTGRTSVNDFSSNATTTGEYNMNLMYGRGVNGVLNATTDCVGGGGGGYGGGGYVNVSYGGAGAGGGNYIPPVSGIVTSSSGTNGNDGIFSPSYTLPPNTTDSGYKSTGGNYGCGGGSNTDGVDGLAIVSFNNVGTMYVSNNSESYFFKVREAFNFNNEFNSRSLAVNGDGTYFVTVDYNDGTKLHTGNLTNFTFNSATTINVVSGPPCNALAISISYNQVYQAIISQTGVYISIDTGSSFNYTYGLTDGIDVYMSNDGKFILVVESNLISISGDFGTTFTPLNIDSYSTTNGIKAGCVSDNGQFINYVVGNRVYTSIDFGNSFVYNLLDNDVIATCVSNSATGQFLNVSVNDSNNLIIGYSSNDYGYSFSQISNSNYYNNNTSVVSASGKYGYLSNPFMFSSNNFGTSYSQTSPVLRNYRGNGDGQILDLTGINITGLRNLAISNGINVANIRQGSISIFSKNIITSATLTDLNLTNTSNETADPYRTVTLNIRSGISLAAPILYTTSLNVYNNANPTSVNFPINYTITPGNNYVMSLRDITSGGFNSGFVNLFGISSTNSYSSINSDMYPQMEFLGTTIFGTGLSLYSQPSNPVNICILSGGEVGFKITPSSSGFFITLTLNMTCFSLASVNMTLNIYNGGGLGGGLLYTAVLPVANFPTNGGGRSNGDYTFLLANPLNLIGGNTYTIGLSEPSGSVYLYGIPTDGTYVSYNTGTYPRLSVVATGIVSVWSQTEVIDVSSIVDVNNMGFLFYPTNDGYPYTFSLDMTTFDLGGFRTLEYQLIEGEGLGGTVLVSGTVNIGNINEVSMYKFQFDKLSTPSVTTNSPYTISIKDVTVGGNTNGYSRIYGTVPSLNFVSYNSSIYPRLNVYIPQYVINFSPNYNLSSFIGGGNDQISVSVETKENSTSLFYTAGLNHSRIAYYEIGLDYLTIPNKLLNVGIGGEIDLYPFVYVQIYNEGYINSVTTLMSNNPNSAIALFKVDVKRWLYNIPTFFYTLEGVECKKQIVVYRPDQNIKFAVLLPDGSIIHTQTFDNLSPSISNPLVQVNVLFNIRALDDYNKINQMVKSA